MRIVHVNLGPRASGVDGIRRAVHTLAEAQRSRGDDVTIWDAGTTTLAPITTLRPDIVHLHSVFRPAHVRLARQLGRKKIPYVLSPHSGLSGGSLARQSWRKLAWISLFDRQLLTNARAVLSLSAVEQADVTSIAPRAHTVVVPNLLPADAAILAAPWTGPSENARPKVVTLARYDVWQKGLDRLASIAKLLPDVDFVVHGETDRNAPRAAQRLIAEAPSNLTFPGPVHGAEKDRVLAEASLFMQPSRWEGMSVALLEALARGIPCAVSTSVAAGIPDAERTVLTLPDDPARAAEHIRAVLHNPAALTQLSSAGPEWIRATTDPSMVLSDLDRAYLGDPIPTGDP